MANKIEIVYQHGKPFGIRDNGGYLLFFPSITKYQDQEDRYKREVEEMKKLAELIKKSIEKHGKG